MFHSFFKHPMQSLSFDLFLFRNLFPTLVSETEPFYSTSFESLFLWLVTGFWSFLWWYYHFSNLSFFWVNTFLAGTSTYHPTTGSPNTTYCLLFLTILKHSFKITLMFCSRMHPCHNFFLVKLIFLVIILFTYLFWGCAGSSLLCVLFPSVATSGEEATLQLLSAGSSLCWLLLLLSPGARFRGLQ